MINLNPKETFYLQDQKKQEELCIKKYNSYSNQAQDTQLKQLFTSNAQQEQQHLDSLNQLLNGQMPSTGGQQQNMQNAQNQSSPTQSNMQNRLTNQADTDLCEDALSSEKYVSATYNTAIFEFRDPNIRQLLNHIQKEEQEHGEKIYNYMSSKGMYNA
jgi:spore coat protein CotF